MFKTFSIFLLFFLLARVGMAYPDVGDKVSWTGEIISAHGAKQAVHITKEVLAKKNETQWQVKITATVGTNKTEQILTVDELFTPEKYNALMSSCQTNGGVLEKLAAPAGTYDTCKMTTTLSDGTVVERWWGDIPFGVVSKSTRTAGPGDTQPDLNSIVAGL